MESRGLGDNAPDETSFRIRPRPSPPPPQSSTLPRSLPGTILSGLSSCVFGSLNSPLPFWSALVCSILWRRRHVPLRLIFVLPCRLVPPSASVPLVLSITFARVFACFSSLPASPVYLSARAPALIAPSPFQATGSSSSAGHRRLRGRLSETVASVPDSPLPPPPSPGGCS